MMTTLRLTTGGACSAAGLDLEVSEDCKVCVTEGLLLLMHAGYRFANVRFSEDDGLFVRLSGEEQGKGGTYSEDEISVALLEALTEASFEHAGDAVSGISFRFGKK